jgi:hypothetical protein
VAKERRKSNREAEKPKKTQAERSKGAAVSTTSGRAPSAASKERAGKGRSA